MGVMHEILLDSSETRLCREWESLGIVLLWMPLRDLRVFDTVSWSFCHIPDIHVEWRVDVATFVLLVRMWNGWFMLLQSY